LLIVSQKRGREIPIKQATDNLPLNIQAWTQVCDEIWTIWKAVLAITRGINKKWSFVLEPLQDYKKQAFSRKRWRKWEDYNKKERRNKLLQDYKKAKTTPRKNTINA
jgi:hypothetical protein